MAHCFQTITWRPNLVAPSVKLFWDCPHVSNVSPWHVSNTIKKETDSAAIQFLSLGWNSTTWGCLIQSSNQLVTELNSESAHGSKQEFCSCSCLYGLRSICNKSERFQSATVQEIRENQINVVGNGLDSNQQNDRRLSEVICWIGSLRCWVLALNLQGTELTKV